MESILGLEVDQDGRCLHYHQSTDIVGLYCSQCHRYYACYLCHQALCQHPFCPSSKTSGWPVLCGSCRQRLTFEQYQKGYCPFCQSPFNPRCQLHEEIYFC
ncbi:hypothetical protein HU830_00725 [Lactobacillus sp. DCY120]|uniref:CHY-type domain-containing protein n=1 Tax=Bombilactobacillus apium TaxID=2675299 RepID=A0A850QVC5_9LACO|nr:hypothetical protein [Bombilactobacillus apium]NVY95734.1 hypothetical protein [Bombilactobacillus apium]